MLPIVVNVVLGMLGLALVLTCIRLLRGPSMADRVVALDLIATLAVGMICVYAISTDQDVYLRDAIVLAVIAFLGTTAFANYLGKGGQP